MVSSYRALAPKERSGTTVISESFPSPMTSLPYHQSTHMHDAAAVDPTGPGVSSTRTRKQTRVQFLDEVQFLDDEAKSGVLVACETSHPGGVIAPLVRGLIHLKLEVHHVESKLSDGVRSERLWVSAPDGEPLSQRRQGLLRTAVFQALESVDQASTDIGELTA